ncbi:hypothetical protein HanIR_Chr15g0763101 [Helianthus annuus]|nr:hypothetical protein HanIR_Chr15g0763101 [Helianthus annuus]
MHQQWPRLVQKEPSTIDLLEPHPHPSSKTWWIVTHHWLLKWLHVATELSVTGPLGLFVA